MPSDVWLFMQVLLEKIAQFVNELRAGGPAFQESAVSAPAAEQPKPVSKAAHATSSAPKVQLHCSVI